MGFTLEIVSNRMNDQFIKELFSLLKERSKSIDNTSYTSQLIKNPDLLAKKLGDRLVVIVNNNHQCVLKKGKPFMDEADRVKIVESIGIVDEVVLSVDEDRSVCASLDLIKPDIFANGGDRSTNEVPEGAICKKHCIKMIDGLGTKIRSSSDLTGLKENN